MYRYLERIWPGPNLATNMPTNMDPKPPVTIVCVYPATYPHEPLMYPTRLRITGIGPTYRLYAYPTQRPADTLVQLQTQIPAIVIYVLGPTWRDELNGRDELSIPQLNWTADDEAAIALRMLQGSAAVLDNSYAMEQWWSLDHSFGAE
jgi:hypothetical protein